MDSKDLKPLLLVTYQLIETIHILEKSARNVHNHTWQVFDDIIVLNFWI